MRGQRPTTDRLERRYCIVRDERTPVRSSFESEVDVGTETVRSSRLGAGLVLVGRHHGGPAGAQRTRHRPGDRAQPAELPDDDAQRDQRGMRGQRLTNRRNAWTGTGLATKQLERPNRVRAADAVRGETAVALEVLQCPCGRWAEDAVGATTVEPQLIERVLEFHDVVASQLRSREDEEPVTEPPSGLDERHPRLFVARTTGVQAPLTLKSGHRLVRGRAESTGRIAGRRQSCRAEASLEVADRLAALSLPQREVTRQFVVARNSSSSWSRAPLLLAPTSRLETSPPENTSSVGMLMTL